MFTRGQAIDFIQNVFGPGILSNQGLNISVVCPICLEQKGISYSKRKLAIRTDNLMCHCWVCNYKSRNLVGLIKRFYSSYLKEYAEKFADIRCLNDKESDGVPFQEKLELPPGFTPLSYRLRFKYVSYIKKRFGYDSQSTNQSSSLDRDIYYWKLGWTTKDPGLVDRLIMLSYDDLGELNYYTARTIHEKVKPKYINANVAREDVIFNEINIDWSVPLTIVEGPFDLIKCNWNSTCLLGSNLTPDYKLFLKLLKHRTTVNLALDPDAKEKALKIASTLYEYDIPVNIINIPDTFKDVGEMTQSQFTSVLANGKPYSKDYSLRIKIAGLLKNI